MNDWTRRNLLAKLGIGAVAAVAAPMTANALTALECGEDLRNGDPRLPLPIKVDKLEPGSVLALTMLPTLEGLTVEKTQVLPEVPEVLGLSPDRKFLDLAVVVRPDGSGVDVLGLNTLFAYAEAAAGRCIINRSASTVSAL